MNEINKSEIKRSVKLQMAVAAGIALAMVLNVGLSLSGMVPTSIVMLFAAMQALVVVVVMMHVLVEKKFIRVLLSFTAVFAICMIGLMISAYFDPIQGTTHNEPEVFAAEDDGDE